MKNRNEILDEIREANMYTMLSREIDLKYHEEVLMPRFTGLKDKKERETKIGNANVQMGNIKILIKDTKAIDGIIEGMINKGKK